MLHKCFLLLLSAAAVHCQPLPPVWSPDGKTVAAAEVEQRYVTPNGAGFILLLNGKPVYPAKRKHGWLTGYDDIHTLLSELVWSPDSQNVAFLEKVYDWEYLDPFNGYFDGAVTRQRFYLAIVSKEGHVKDYRLKTMPGQPNLHWQDAETLSLHEHTFQMAGHPPSSIP